jgi:hypothetical protein
LVEAALGITPKEKYFSQFAYLQDPKDPTKMRAYRVQMAAGAPAEAIEFPGGEGMIFAGKPGSTVKGLKYNTSSNTITDGKTGHEYYDGDDDNPPNIKKMFDSVHAEKAEKLENLKEVTRERGKAFNDSKTMRMIDNRTGRAVTIQYSDYKADVDRMAAMVDEAHPYGRESNYVPQEDYNLYAPRANLMEDLRGGSRVIRKDIERLRAEGGLQFGDLADSLTAALASEHPYSTITAMVHQGALASLTPAQQKFVIDTAAMNEQAMSMRVILGAGGGAQDIRAAILGTLPSILSPSADFAAQQLDQFDGTLEALHQNIPTNILLAGGRGIEANWWVQNKPSPYSLERQAGPTAGPAGGGGGAGGQGGGGAPPPVVQKVKISTATDYWAKHPDEAMKKFGHAPTQQEVIDDIKNSKDKNGNNFLPY